MSTVDCFVIRNGESLPDRNVPEDEWPLSVTEREQARALAGGARENVAGLRL